MEIDRLIREEKDSQAVLAIAKSYYNTGKMGFTYASVLERVARDSEILKEELISKTAQLDKKVIQYASQTIENHRLQAENAKLRKVVEAAKDHLNTDVGSRAFKQTDIALRYALAELDEEGER